MTETNKVVLAYMEIERLSDDIVRFKLTRDIYLTIEMAMEMVEVCKKLCPDRIYKSLKIVNYKMQLQEEVVDFLASDSRKNMISMEAVVVNSVTLKLFGNFYLKIKRPVIKTRVFDNETNALKWLKEN